jgi:homoserine kinase
MDEHDKILEQWNFKKVKIGNLAFPLHDGFRQSAHPVYKRVRVTVPGRLFALFKNIKGLVEQEPTGEFNYGEVSFGVNLRTHADVSLFDTLHVTESTRRASIVRHAAEITRQQAGYTGGLLIEANNDFPYRHVGSGSSAALFTATALAINKLLGDPIQIDKLPRFLAQNYGEEIDGDHENLITVQCTGGTSWMGLKGGIILVDKSQLLHRMVVPEEFGYVIGVPDYPKPDAKGAMAREAGGIFQDILDKLPEMDRFHREVFAEVGRAIKENDIVGVGKGIYKAFSYDPFMQLFDNMFPGIKQLFWKLRDLMQKHNPVATFISSAGPGIVTVCNKHTEKEIMDCYEQLGIDYLLTPEPANTGYIYEVME